MALGNSRPPLPSPRYTGEGPSCPIRIYAMTVSWPSRFPAGFAPAPPFAALLRCGPRTRPVGFSVALLAGLEGAGSCRDGVSPGSYPPLAREGGKP